MLGSFPYEAEPDGAVFGPHHFYLGVLLILLVCWMANDPDSEDGPWGVAGLALLSVFAFALTWPYYPAVGAVGVLVLLGVATALSVGRPFWWRSGVGVQFALLLGLAVAWDDALNHALGWRTPLDAVWAEHLHPYVSDPYLPSPSEVRLPNPPGMLPDAGLLADVETLVFERLADAVAVVAL